MNDVQLREVLHRAAAPLEAPDLARATLVGAGRARRRRRVGTVVLAAAVVVAAVGIGAVGRDDGRRPPSPAPTPVTPVPGPDEPQDELDRVYALPTPPPIDESVVQPVWDPATVATLPWVDLGLPERLDELRFDLPEMPDIPTVLALLDGDDGLQVVATDGERYRLDAPDDPLTRVGSVSELSRDGAVAVYAGQRALWWLEFAGGGWRRTDYPAEVLALDGWDVHLIAETGPTVLLGRKDRSWRIDLAGGTATPVGGSLDGVAVHDDVTVRTRLVGGLRVLGVGPIGERGQEWRVDPLAYLAGTATDGLSLAATRENVSYTLPRRGTDRDGLVALDLDDLSTRAYLPFAGGLGDYYAALGGTEALAWLDADTVLLAMVPRGADARWLVTWQVETGELRRVTRLQTGTDVSVADQLLRP